MTKQIINEQYFVLTGAMGAGKTALLKELQHLGYQTIDESARCIISEQREIDGEGIYDRDPKLFYNLMLSREILQYKQHIGILSPIIGDRGIVDIIVHGRLFHLNTQAAENAAKIYRYNTKVFYLPAWKEIFTNDDERRMSYTDAKQFGDKVRDEYINLGYQLIEVPFNTPKIRAEYVINSILCSLKS